MNQLRNKKGFTLVELMLSMSFIGMLLVAIAATSMHLMHTYTKGVTIREVNQVGRVISEDLERTISSSPRFKVNPAKTGDPSDPPGSSDSKYVTRDGGGRLCTGSYTYAWNYGKTRELAGDPGMPPVYNVYADNSENIRFVKVSDSGGLLCRNPNTAITKASARELLAAGDRNLAIQQLTVVEGAKDEVSGQALYALSLRLGTNDRTQLNATGTTCLPPSQGSGNEDFCAINQFDIVTRAGNRSGSI
jgi:prepilin-type N-terminal cleavage/methylation domain-containing protein